MDKAITTILLLIAGIVCTVLVINTVYPAVNRSTAAMVTIADKADERIQTQVEIIQTANVGKDVYVWVKNIGTAASASPVNASESWLLSLSTTPTG